MNTEISTQLNYQEYTLLIMDDNPTNLAVLTYYLEIQGFEILSAEDGYVGLEIAQFAQPNLILLDVMMPGIDGFETCLRLKANQKTQDIPVIFMTALESTQDKVNGFKVGGVDYITKPVKQEEVLARITTHLRIQALTHQLQQANQKLSRSNQELSKANQTITALNEQLKDENLRMKSELKVAHRLQQMALPLESELKQIKELDIVGFMEPAQHVGGDYYDVLAHDGQLKIGIGDVTGHGLESGILMLIVQTAVQSLLESGTMDSKQFLNILNRIIYNSVQRMRIDKNLTLSLLDYQDGKLRVTGQHEEILVVRKDGQIERINTIDLGFMLGLMPNIAHIVSQIDIQLQQGDGIVLYTDGITEARNTEAKLYGIERLCEVVCRNWPLTAQEIQQAVVADLKQHIGTQEVFDDITLLILKQK